MSRLRTPARLHHAAAPNPHHPVRVRLRARPPGARRRRGQALDAGRPRGGGRQRRALREAVPRRALPLGRDVAARRLRLLRLRRLRLPPLRRLAAALHRVAVPPRPAGRALGAAAGRPRLLRRPQPRRALRRARAVRARAAQRDARQGRQPAPRLVPLVVRRRAPPERGRVAPLHARPPLEALAPVFVSGRPGNRRSMADAARKAFVVTVVAVGVVVFALALWKLKVLVALLFLAFTVAAAMRPGIEWLAQRRVPRPVGVLIHYVVLAVAVGLLLWLAVPRAISQVDQAVQSVPAQRAQLGDAARHSTGIRHDILVGLQNRLSKLPRASTLVRPALHITVTAFEILIGVFFGLGAGIVVLVQRQLEDYLIAPRILGGAVGLSPLLVIVSVFATGILWAPAVVFAIPMVAVLTTLVDVAVLNRDPSKEDVPTVLFPAKEAES